MGNKSCTLGIQTEKSTYFSNDVVNGRIYLSVTTDEGILAQSLNLHLHGIEKGIVHYVANEERTRNDGTTDTHSHSHYEENEIQILHFDVPVNTPVGSRFMRGQYEFPFQFVIPNNIPSSMYCRNGESKCEIKYEMRAYLSKDQRSGGSFMNPFNSSTISSKPTPFHIYGNTNNNYHDQTTNNQPINLPSEVHKVRNCFCCHRGTMELHASITNTNLIPQQPQTISFRLQNQSKANTENVTVEVIERVSWRPRFRHETNEYVLAKHVINGNTHRDWMSTEQRVNEAFRTFMHQQYQPANSQDHQNVEVCIPHKSRDTYDGKMITVDHYVRVRVNTKGCCTSNPETTTDVFISRPAHLFSSNQNASFSSNQNAYEINPPMSMPAPSAPVMEEEHVVEATVLPDDWAPMTSEVVKLPVATVMGVSSSTTTQDSAFQTGSGSYAAPSAVPIVSAVPVPSAPVPSAPPKGS